MRQIALAGSCIETLPLSHSLTQIRDRLSLQTRRAPCLAVGGSTIVDSPLARSMRAMNEPASEHHQTSPRGVVQMPYGPVPRGASLTLTSPLFDDQLADDPGLAGEPEVAVADRRSRC